MCVAAREKSISKVARDESASDADSRRLSLGFACATDDADTDGRHLQVKDTNFLTHDNVFIRQLNINAHDEYFVILQHS